MRLSAVMAVLLVCVALVGQAHAGRQLMSVSPSSAPATSPGPAAVAFPITVAPVGAPEGAPEGAPVASPADAIFVYGVPPAGAPAPVALPPAGVGY